MGYTLETKNLTKKYGQKTIINAVDIRISPGEIFALVGLNGAGKTTTIKMLLGLINPSYGLIKYMDMNFLTSKQEILPRIGSVLENPGFYDHMTVHQNLKMIQNVVGIHEHHNIDEVLSIIGMDAFKYEKVKNLTKAHRQKLALSRALLNSPDILILDEPMNGFDPISAKEIRTVLRRLSKEKQVTILISSHVLAEVEKIADTIGFMKNGKMVKIIDLKSRRVTNVDRLYLTIDDVTMAKKVLEENDIKYKYRHSNQIVLKINNEAVDDILKLMMDNEINVDEMFFKPYGLEEIFLDLMEK